MKEELEKDIPKQVIVIPDSDILWVKKGKEIFVNGKMFDIKTITSHNGFTTFTGLYDEEETALKKQLADDWNKKAPQRNQLLVQLIFSLKCTLSANYTDGAVVSAIRKKRPHLFKSQLPDNYRKILTPPPQV
jgi:hypothetical protein